MNKKIKTLFKTILILFLITLSIKMYFRLIYYPSHPNIIYSHEPKENYDPSQNNVLEPEPPVGGCFDVCFGNTEKIKCKEYTSKYNKCEYYCYGYVYNNCSSPKLGIIFGQLIR